jgi:hypothetical protein
LLTVVFHFGGVPEFRAREPFGMSSRWLLTIVIFLWPSYSNAGWETDDGADERYWEDHSVVYAEVASIADVNELTTRATITLNIRATLTGPVDAATTPRVRTELFYGAPSDIDEPPPPKSNVIVLLLQRKDGLIIPHCSVAFMPYGLAIKTVKSFDDTAVQQTIVCLRRLRAKVDILGDWIGVSCSQNGMPFQKLGPKESAKLRLRPWDFTMSAQLESGRILESNRLQTMDVFNWFVDDSAAPMEVWDAADEKDLPFERSTRENMQQRSWETPDQKGKIPPHRRAIFRLDGDELLWCMVGSDEKPPFTLAPKKGDGHTIVRFRWSAPWYRPGSVGLPRRHAGPRPERKK